MNDVSRYADIRPSKMAVKFKTKLVNKLEFSLELFMVLLPHHAFTERRQIKFGNFDFFIRLDAVDTCYTILIFLLDRYKNVRKDVTQAFTITSKKGKVNQKRFFCDDTKWRILYKENHPSIVPYKTDITVESETMVLKNPFAVLYDDTELTDFELCAEGGSVQFHSTVLAAASPSLRRMLAGRWAETESRTLTLKDTTRTTLQHLKDYLYTNRLPDMGIEPLLILASCHMMTDLENECTEKLLSQVTTETSTELARFALSNNLMKLYYAFLGLVREGFIDVGNLQEKELKLENMVLKH